MYQFENFKNKPLTERVVDNILSDIADNNIKVGTKLPNKFELAEMFGVGRSTI
ncbi:MAG: GntR family transcriptional regulator [Clostridiales bacterium]|nr:GntR family transcriptional regulator [Clostridiales bacterium]